MKKIKSKTKQIHLLLKHLSDLELPQNSYVIGGSGPLGIRGLREIDDLDVVVMKDIFEKLRKQSGQDTSKNKYGHLIFGDIDIGYTWQNSEEKALEVINNAETIENYPFAKLDYVLEWKKEMGREKDVKDIALINQYLEKQKILTVPKNKKHIALLSLIYSAGLRVSEAATLQLQDIDRERKILHIKGAKGKKDRYTLLSSEFLKKLDIYLTGFPTKKWVFPGQDPEKHISVRSIEKIFNYALRHAGI